MTGETSPALLSLIFATGQRPSAAALREAGSRPDGIGFAITHQAEEPGATWAELLASGLTFDCHGLAPGGASTRPPGETLLGLTSEPEGEAISLAPGPHIADGAALQPVLRMLLALALDLARLPGVQAVCWHPAASAMEPGYFIRIAEDWLGGGPFPGLGLIAVRRQKSGGLATQGLAFFVGQELAIEPDKSFKPADIAQLAVRLIDELIQLGPVSEPREFALPGSPAVLAIPIEQGRILRVVRRQHAN